MRFSRARSLLGTPGHSTAEPSFYNFEYRTGKFASAFAVCDSYRAEIQSDEDKVNPGGVAVVVHYPRADLPQDEGTGDICAVDWTGPTGTEHFGRDVYRGGCGTGRFPKPDANEYFNDSECGGYGDQYFGQPGTCPAFGHPIYPLTGARRETVDLGMTVGGLPVTVTYDTSTELPEASGGLTFLVPPPPSFGPHWQSNLHKSLVLQSGGATAGSPQSTLALNRGGGVPETAAVAGVSGCGASDSGSSLSYAPTINRAERITMTGNGAGGRVVDQGALAEETYDSTGAVTSIAQAAGGTLSFVYDQGLLKTVSDQFERSVRFDYEQPAPELGQPPRVKTVTAPDGAQTIVAYDPTSGELTSLTWPSGRVQTFLHELPALPWAVTGVLDESDIPQRYMSWGYDPAGRSNSTYVGSGFDKYTAQYAPVDGTLTLPSWVVTNTYDSTTHFTCRQHRWSVPTGTTVTPPQTDAGPRDIALNATQVNGQVRLATQTQPAGSGCSASSSAQSYDANGNVTIHDDFNGYRTCYAYDMTRNLRTATLEGLSSSTACPVPLLPTAAGSSPPQRLITTQWHPDWVLKAREAEPKKITTWVYNGQTDPITPAHETVTCAPGTATLPDNKPIAMLCRRYEQATTDLTGAARVVDTNNAGNARVWNYAYNAAGQVLTEVAPKQVSSDPDSKTTTTYAYYPTTSFPNGVSGHTMGDLMTVTNALKQVTQFTLYDKAGRLLSSTDANNTVTMRTYWPRGWLHTVTVTPASGAALTTTYDYWPTGLLRVATMPDGSTLTYGYDDAHRLTDVTDAAGNTVHYTLDNSGNRTGEQVKDASGKLAASIARVYDALNRLQTVTGATH